jgi:hypothetical protein
LVYKNFDKKVVIERNEEILITIVYKKKRHSILNYDELFEHLKKKYSKFKILQIVPSKLSKEEEIDIISKTNILITPFIPF